MAILGNGFIAAVNECIELLKQYGDKITPELLKGYLDETAHKYVNTSEFLNYVVNALGTSGANFVNEIEELYRVRDNVNQAISVTNINAIVDARALNASKTLYESEEYIRSVADFILTTDRFDGIVKQYLNEAVEKAVGELNPEVFVTEEVKKNTQRYSELLLGDTRRTQAQAEASYFVIKTLEQLCIIKQKCFVNPDYLHPQIPDRKGGITQWQSKKSARK